MPEPNNPLQADSIVCYRAAIRWLWQDHLLMRESDMSQLMLPPPVYTPLSPPPPPPASIDDDDNTNTHVSSMTPADTIEDGKQAAPSSINPTPKTWDEIWIPALEYLIKVAKKRAPKNKKKNYGEKLDHEFAPYSLVERFPDIEAATWNRGQHCIKSAFTWLRHRYCLLHSCHGILRCESIFKGELSDCLMLRVEATPHHMMILIQQLATGKTNQFGRKNFGRVMRHKQVELCGVGAFAMYLALRFHITKEFEHEDRDAVDEEDDNSVVNGLFKYSNWFDNQKWYDVKILIDAFNPKRDWTAMIRNNTYAQAMKSVLNELTLPSTHYVHLGRKIGPKRLELLETEAAQIDSLGGWANGMRDQRYSGKLPMEAIKQQAGYTNTRQKGGRVTHLNARQGVTVPNVLLLATPFAFCYEARRYMEQEMSGWHVNRPRPHAAMAYLDLMHQLNTIFLQDMAALWVLETERQEHPIYRLAVFHTDEWTAFVASMRSTLEDSNATTVAEENRGVEQHLPGILDQFSGVRQVVIQSTDSVKTEVIAELKDLKDAMLGCQSLQKDDIRKALWNALQALGGPMSSAQTPATAAAITTATATSPSTVRGRPAARRQQQQQHPSHLSAIVPHAKYQSLSQLWADWDTTFEPMEKAHGTGWRSSYTSPEIKHFSRVKQVATGIKEFFKQHEGSPVVSLAILDAKFKEDFKTLPKTIQWMQGNGYLRKGKSRGRTQTKA